MWAVPVGVAAYLVGAGVSALRGEGLWAWVVGGLPGAMAWIAFAVLALLVATDASRSPRQELAPALIMAEWRSSEITLQPLRHDQRKGTR